MTHATMQEQTRITVEHKQPEEQRARQPPPGLQAAASWKQVGRERIEKKTLVPGPNALIREQQQQEIKTKRLTVPETLNHDLPYPC